MVVLFGNRSRPYVLFLVATPLLLGCGHSDRPIDRPDLPEWSLLETVRIGHRDGPGALSSVIDIHVADSTVWVLDSRPYRVVAFSADGQRVASFGEVGRGPGEFTAPIAIGSKGDSVYVVDPYGHGIQLFTQTGDFIRAVGFRVEPDPRGTTAYPRGFLFPERIVAGPVGLPMEGVNLGQVDHQNLYITSPSGLVEDSLYTITIPATDFFQASLDGGGIVHGGHPLMEVPLFDVFRDGSGLAVAERWLPDGGEAAYTVRIWDATGASNSFTVAYDPTGATGWMDRVAEEYRAATGRLPGPEIRDALAGRETLPPVSDIIAGRDGLVLVRREETGSDSARWDVFDVQRGRIAWFKLAADLDLMSASFDGVWAVSTDELDVPSLVRYEVTAR